VPTLDHFKWIAPYYDRIFPLDDAGYLRELLQLPAEGQLLDLGGGTGRVSAALRSWAGRIVVLDELPEMLRQAKLKGLETVQAHAECLPFADGSFDRILLVDVIHHLTDAPQAICEACRLLRPPASGTGRDGGRLVIEEANIGTWKVKLVALAERLLLLRSRFRSPADILRMLTRCDVRAEVRRQGGKVWIVAEKQRRSPGSPNSQTSTEKEAA